jgi:hypothetical protein
MAVSFNLGNVLGRAYEHKGWKRIHAAPPSAMEGVKERALRCSSRS